MEVGRTEVQVIFGYLVITMPVSTCISELVPKQNTKMKIYIKQIKTRNESNKQINAKQKAEGKNVR